MPRACTFEFETCTCTKCAERRYRDQLTAQAEAELAADALAEEQARTCLTLRQAQLRLPMPGLALCADQPATLDAAPPLQLEILS